MFIDGDMLLHPSFIADHQRLARPGFYTQGVRVHTDAALTKKLIAEPAALPSFWSAGLGGLRRLYLLRSPALASMTRTLANHFIAIKSCNLGIWRDDLVRVNGFNEAFEGWGPEDKELCVRLEQCRRPPPDADVRRHRLPPAPCTGIARRAARESGDARRGAARTRGPAATAASTRISAVAPRRAKRMTCGNIALPNGERACPASSLENDLVRHGQSTWNVENLFTGWHDVDLSDLGRIEAKSAGAEIKKAGIKPDIVFTSVLKRAIRTMWSVLDEMDLMWLPVERSWRLNERHYGALQGLDKAQTVEKHGEAQVKIWRRSYDIPPPPLALDDQRHPIFDRRYANVDPRVLPASESLKDTLARVLPFWNDRIVAELLAGKNVLVVAHGNSPARRGEDARQRERGGDHRAQHPHRRAAGVRARRRRSSPSRAVISATPRPSRPRRKPSRNRPRRRSS